MPLRKPLREQSSKTSKKTSHEPFLQNIPPLTWWEKAIVPIQGFRASKVIKLDPEPVGARHGIVAPNSNAEVSETFTLIAVGDSMVAGCGTDNQSKGFIPQVAQTIANSTHKAVEWRAVGRLGATMRRVRFKLLPQVQEKLGKNRCDLLVICAGSNDLLAQRTLEEFSRDLRATLDIATTLATHVVILSPGQLFNNPRLQKALKHYLHLQSNQLVSTSYKICAEYGVHYINMTEVDVSAQSKGFYANDNFHPNAYGYGVMAEKLLPFLEEAHVL